MRHWQASSMWVSSVKCLPDSPEIIDAVNNYNAEFGTGRNLLPGSGLRMRRSGCGYGGRVIVEFSRSGQAWRVELHATHYHEYIRTLTYNIGKRNESTSLLSLSLLTSPSRIKPNSYIFPSPIGATAPIWALTYLHETLRFTSVFF
jgi:hypothetical protein